MTSKNNKSSNSNAVDLIKFIAVARASDKKVLCYYHVKHTQGADENFLTMTNTVISAPSWAAQVPPGSTHSLSSNNNKFHFKMDTSQLVYLIVAADHYPTRVAYQLLDTCEKEFTASYKDVAASAVDAHALNKTKSVTTLLKSLVTRYHDPAVHDKITSVRSQVEEVKVTIQDSMTKALANTEAMEQVEEKTERLNQQAKVFKTAGKSLQRRMWCQNIKLNIILALGLSLMLLVVLAMCGVFSDNNNGGDDSVKDTGNIPEVSTVPSDLVKETSVKPTLRSNPESGSTITS